MQLTIGKIRGLAATSSQAGAFTILAFDHQVKQLLITESKERE
ncbi:MAG TPA: hypothetical protein VMW34_16780 [Anaerolineales bacterium]|jgi:hypothetical protein|nr:hypothetical protein [Anaerolineales bacterium]